MSMYVWKDRNYSIVTAVIGNPNSAPWQPSFTVRLAGQSAEEWLHQEAFESSFPSQGEAFAVAHRAAIEWIQVHGDEKGNG